MSKKTIGIIIGVIIVILLLIGIIYFATTNQGETGGTSNQGRTSTSILDDYDSGYEQEDIFANGEIPNVEVTFGNGGTPFIATIENNETAIELVRNITSSGRDLPIYNYDDFEGYEYFQYYDIPSRYDIPSNPIHVTEEKAGEIYYSEPNRVMIFYRDANIEGDFTKIGEIQNTEGLRDAVENNPVLEGWGNKIVSVNYED